VCVFVAAAAADDVVATLGPGDHFGETAMLEAGIYHKHP